MNNKSTSLYHSDYIDFTNQPMFLGEGKNTQRFDVLKYKFFDDRNARMQGFDWTFDEVKLKNDYIDFNTKMKDHEKFMYTKELQKLIFLDSLQGRGILLTLGQIVTLPEVENAMLTWEYFEGAKHSKTYTENLKGVYNNPSEIFDASFDIPVLNKIAGSISKPYDDAYELIIEMQYNIIKNNVLTPEFMKKLKTAVLKLIVTINILEGVRFYSGFSTIWALNKSQGYVEGTSKNLKLICLHPESEILTSQGWKKIEDVTIDDKVAQFDMDTNTTSFDYTTRKTWIDYSGDMYRIVDSNNNVIQHVAKDHELVVARKSNGVMRNSKVFVQDSKLNTLTWYPQGGRLETQNALHHNLSTLDRFRIMVQADGNIDIKRNGSISGHQVIHFTLKKQRKIKLFESYTEELGISYTKRTSANGAMVYYVKVPLSLNITKDFEWVKLDEISENYINEFLLELIKWDGSDISETSDRYFFGNTDKRVVDKVIALITLSRYKLFPYKQEDNREKHYKDYYKIYFREDENIINTQRYRKERYNYTGKIGCVTMPKGTIITKSIHNKVCVTGNCRDENIHLQLTQMILKILRKEESEGFSEIYKEFMPEITQMYATCYEEECEWIDFKFSKGSILGLNAEISKQYLEYNINKRLRSLGQPIMFQGRSTNPIPWIDNYINFSDNEVLPQETEIVNYVSGGVDNDVSMDYDKIEL